MGIESTGYKVLLVLHILAVIAAFAPTFLHGILMRRAEREPAPTASQLISISSLLHNRVSMPALCAAAVFGMGLVGSSAKLFSFSNTWVSLALLVVIVLILVGWFMLRPALAQAAIAVVSTDDNAASQKRSARYSVLIATELFHFGLLVLVTLMIWKP